MNRRGHNGRVDANHQEIVQALRKAGIGAVSLASVGGGVPDILASFRQLNCLLEVKVPGKKLTVAEQEFHDTWPGHRAVVESAEEAITAVLDHAKAMGRI